MARQTTMTLNNADRLPMWDTFEASFFVGAGLSVGIVLGILFPSLWRTFRRHFRKSSHYAPKDIKLEQKLSVNLKILREDLVKNQIKENETLPSKNKSFIFIAEAFVLARNFFQTNNPREAIKIYIDILTHQHVSKQETHRALYELSQVYSFIGLYTRAFDTALELFRRKPKNSEILEHILSLCNAEIFLEQLNAALAIYKGNPDQFLRLSIAHTLCHLAEKHMKEEKKIEDITELARRAVRWERSSGRAVILLWETTSLQLWQKAQQEPQMMWAALSADLEALIQIYQETQISPAAGAPYLSKILLQMSAKKEILESYDLVQNEFKTMLKSKKIDSNAHRNLDISIFYAALLIQKSFVTHLECLSEASFLPQILNLLSEKQNIFQYVAQQGEAASLGYSSHYCEKCHAFYSTFSWKCLSCHAYESLKPKLIPYFKTRF